MDIAGGDSIYKSSVIVKTNVKYYVLSDNRMTFFDIKLLEKIYSTNNINNYRSLLHMCMHDCVDN